MLNCCSVCANTSLACGVGISITVPFGKLPALARMSRQEIGCNRLHGAKQNKYERYPYQLVAADYLKPFFFIKYKPFIQVPLTASINRSSNVVYPTSSLVTWTFAASNCLSTVCLADFISSTISFTPFPLDSTS